jgi:hypothetical protein
VIQAEETRQVLGVASATARPEQASEVTSAATEVGGDPTVVMEVEVELVTCPLMECRLGGTLAEHPSTIF